MSPLIPATIRYRLRYNSNQGSQPLARACPSIYKEPTNRNRETGPRDRPMGAQKIYLEDARKNQEVNCSANRKCRRLSPTLYD